MLAISAGQRRHTLLQGDSQGLGGVLYNLRGIFEVLPTLYVRFAHCVCHVLSQSNPPHIGVREHVFLTFLVDSNVATKDRYFFVIFGL